MAKPHVGFYFTYVKTLGLDSNISYYKVLKTMEIWRYYEL